MTLMTYSKKLVSTGVAFILVGALLGVALAQEASQEATSQEPVTSAPTAAPQAVAGEASASDVVMCPVTTDEPIDPNFSTEYKGKTVYFCCRKCRTKFEADPDAYVANLPQFASMGAEMVQVDKREIAETTADVNDHEITENEHAESEQTESTNEVSDDEHDHTTDHGSGDEGFDAIAYVGRFHILAIHFPIALLALGAFFEGLFLTGVNKGARAMVRPLIAFGALGAIFAMLLGLANGVEAEYSGTLGWVFWWHRALGITTASVAVLAWAAVEWRRVRPDSTIGRMAAALVIASAIAVGVTAHFGGSLVYGWTYLIPGGS